MSAQAAKAHGTIERMNTGGAQNSETSDDVVSVLSQRAPIEQAKGMLMAIHRIDADAAFARLVEVSQHSNRKLRDVAQDFVDQASADNIR